jgi:hypothetical protein
VRYLERVVCACRQISYWQTRFPMLKCFGAMRASQPRAGSAIVLRERIG